MLVRLDSGDRQIDASTDRVKRYREHEPPDPEEKKTSGSGAVVPSADVGGRLKDDVGVAGPGNRSEQRGNDGGISDNEGSFGDRRAGAARRGDRILDNNS